MAYTLKDKIFGFFGVSAKRRDTFKDVNGKGIWQRYNESLGDDYDNHVRDLIDNPVDNILVPQTTFDRFIIYLEYNVGMPLQLSNNMDFRRKMLWLNNVITLTKGTIASYRILFNLINISSVTVTNLSTESGFDSSLTFDDDERKFDGRGTCCFHYKVDLVGSAPITQLLIDNVWKILYYLKPVNAELITVTYNGDPIPESGDTGIFDVSFDESFE